MKRNSKRPSENPSGVRDVLILIAIGLALRLALSLTVERVIRWDEPDYLWLGRSLWTGQGYTVAGRPELHYAPLLPILAGAVYFLTGNPEWGTNLWYILLGAALVLPVYTIARRIHGRAVATISGLLVALYPGLAVTPLFWGTMTEPLFLLLVYSAAWTALLALEKERLWAYALTGALLALAYLARPEGLVWMAALGVLFVVTLLATKRLLRGRTLVALSMYVLCFILVSTPYAIYLHEHTGKWMTTGKLGITYDIGEAVLESDPVKYDQVTAGLDTEGEMLWWSSQRFETSLTELILRDPAKALARTWSNARRMKALVFSRNVFPLYLLAPVLLGWLRKPWDRRRLSGESILWFTSLPVLAFLPFHVEVRFFSPAFPALLIWVAVGLWAGADWLAETIAAQSESADGERAARLARAGRGIGLALLLVVLMVYMAIAGRSIIRNGQADFAYAHKEAGLWLKANAPPDAVVLARDLAVALYAERGWVGSPHADYQAFLDYARRKGADYVVVDEYELRVLRPQLAFLLDDARPPEELDPLFSASDRRGRTIVYRLKD